MACRGGGCQEEGWVSRGFPQGERIRGGGECPGGWGGHCPGQMLPLPAFHSRPPLG